MKIVLMNISNFRGLQNVSLEPDKDTNVIVGPNAIGKTTILEAVRLLKAILAPRYSQEAQQALTSLGALPQHFQFFGVRQIDYPALAGDPANDIRIAVDVAISDEEVKVLRDNISNLALGLVRTRLGGAEEQKQIALTQFLSSAEGRSSLSEANETAAERLEALATARRLSLQLTISAQKNAIFGNDNFSQIAFAALDQRLPIQTAALSYFPADRAFPPGEVNIQIGSADASNQVQSHLGNPATKYHRLKQVIVQGIITSQIDRSWLDKEFNLILEHLVPGKELKGVSINELGQLKVLIKDVSSGKIFDIDSMSSGEKGVILTFLLIRHTLADGAILLIDEPELHLNPAVEKKLLPFLIEHCVKPQKLQVFACTHSPEILGAAFDRDDTNLFHLRSPVDLTKVFRRDQAEMFEALRRLGASTADVLFSRGTIVVEGEHDSEVLNEGFFELVSGFKITRAGGRSEVEKEIKNLQDAERRNEINKMTLAILDLDTAPTTLQGTTLVRVLQWDRYCLENYLLEPNILFDLVSELATRKPESRGSFTANLKELAMGQLTDIAVRSVYEGMTPDNPGIRSGEVAGKSVEEISRILAIRLAEIKRQTSNIETDQWCDSFQKNANKLRNDLEAKWQTDWPKQCNGKRLLQDLYRKFEINIDSLTFKKRIIRHMRNDKTDLWHIVESRLRGSLS